MSSPAPRVAQARARPADWTTPQKAQNKVYHDPDRLSYVELPLFPPD